MMPYFWVDVGIFGRVIEKTPWAGLMVGNVPQFRLGAQVEKKDQNPS